MRWGPESGTTAQAAAAYDVVAQREKLPVNKPRSVLEACRSVVAATLFYGTDLYQYVQKKDGKYRGLIRWRRWGLTTRPSQHARRVVAPTHWLISTQIIKLLTFVEAELAKEE